MKAAKSFKASLAFAIFCALGATGSAQAQVADAAASGVSVHINLLGLSTLNIDPQPVAQVTAAVVASVDQDTLPGLDLGDAFLHLQAGVLTSYAEYAPSSISAAGATSSVADLDVSAVGLLGVSLLSVSADLIRSRATVSGYCLPAANGPQADGMFDDFIFATNFDSGNLSGGDPGRIGGNPDDIALSGLHISILGIDVPNLPLNPAPNTGIDLSGLGIVGATLVLNEQVVAGDGVTGIAKSANAVHLSLNVAGLITADVVVGHSEASMACPG